MADSKFHWPINVPESQGLAVARDIGFVAGSDFVCEGRTFWFDGIEKAMQFNRALADEPNTGRGSPDDAPNDAGVEPEPKATVSHPTVSHR